MNQFEKRRHVKRHMLLALMVSVIIVVLAIGLGSVYIPPGDVTNILISKVLHIAPRADIEAVTQSILWKIRVPRALLAFVVGAALAVSGTIMQSVLKNPLASSFTLGVSSGAALGASAVMVFGLYLPVIGVLTLPLVGFLCGLLTVFLAIGFASKLDENMENQTIILVGMVMSLFVNALLTIIVSMSDEHMPEVIYWQMGSFSLKDWSNVIILLPIVIVGTIVTMRYAHELDIMSFGEDHARAMGIEIKHVKLFLIAMAALLTGSAISFVGVIGFIDLISPHFARRIFGSSHKYLVPMSALFGGSLMVISDLIARTIIAPSELPVGAVTALIGAPFFAFVFFSKRKKG
ncbi:FecCD family ABC transporter permease [Fusibacter paucivorans]